MNDNKQSLRSKSSMRDSAILWFVIGAILLWAGNAIPEHFGSAQMGCNMERLFAGYSSFNCFLISVALSLHPFIIMLGFGSLIFGAIFLFALYQEHAAIVPYNKAIELEPDNPGNYSERGHFFVGKQDLDKALADYNKAVEMDPNDASYINNRGAVLEGKGEYHKALEDYKKAAHLDPKNTQYSKNYEHLKVRLK